MKWHRDRDKDKADFTEVEEVIAEAQRLLSGRTFNAQRGYRRRGWALTGALAHGDREELQKLAGAGVGGPSNPRELVTLVLAALDAHPIYRDR